MQVSRILIALTVAAGFSCASFAQGTTTAPAVQSGAAAKVVAPAPASAEKKIEAPKAAEPAKSEAAKPVQAKAKGKVKAKAHKAEKHEGAGTPAPATK